MHLRVGGLDRGIVVCAVDGGRADHQTEEVSDIGTIGRVAVTPGVALRTGIEGIAIRVNTTLEDDETGQADAA